MIHFSDGDRVVVTNYETESYAEKEVIGVHGTVIEYDGPWYEVELDTPIAGVPRWLFYPDEISLEE